MKNAGFILTAIALCACALLPAEAPHLRVRVLALEPNGSMASGLAPDDWKVLLDDKDAKVVAVRTPQDMGARPMKWVIVTLPVKNPALRQAAVMSIGRFLETLPALDQVLLVNRGKTGLESLTPGFTTRPSLWAKALERLVEELAGRLDGSVVPFQLPSSPPPEAEEPMTPVTAFLRDQERKEPPRRVEDMKSSRSVLEDYAPSDLGGFTRTVLETLGELEKVARAVAAVPGEKEILLFSHNEIDDLSNPIWKSAIHRSGVRGAREEGYGQFTARDYDNQLLQVQMMVTDVTLAKVRVRDAFARDGLIVHNIAARGTGFYGAFAETASATGGLSFNLAEKFDQRINQTLGLWPQSYELTLEAPITPRPSKLEVGTRRKGLKIIAPGMR